MNSRWDAGAYPPREHSGQREILVGGWRPLPVTVAESECPSRGGFWFGRTRPLGSEPRVDTEEAAAPVASGKELSEGLSTSRDPAQPRGSTDAQPPTLSLGGRAQGRVGVGKAGTREYRVLNDDNELKGMIAA